MSEIRTATAPKEPFTVEAKNDGGFRVQGLVDSPLPITRKQAEAWLKWMEDGGMRTLHRLLEKK
jgi:hypothetical protein